MLKAAASATASAATTYRNAIVRAENCRGLKHDGLQCVFKPYGGNAAARFCRNHQYMSTYTTEMLEAMQKCLGCNKYYFFGEGGEVAGEKGNVINQCTKCAARGRENREKARTNAVKCEFVVLETNTCCTNKKQQGSKYCGRHKLQSFVDATAAAGKKLCYQYIRGCRAQLEPDYAFSKCPDCLDVERMKDHNRRGAAQAMRASAATTTTTVEEVTHADAGAGAAETLMCTVCAREKPREGFVGIRVHTTRTCWDCRESNRVQDERRRDDPSTDLQWMSH